MGIDGAEVGLFPADAVRLRVTVVACYLGTVGGWVHGLHLVAWVVDFGEEASSDMLKVAPNAT